MKPAGRQFSSMPASFLRLCLVRRYFFVPWPRSTWALSGEAMMMMLMMKMDEREGERTETDMGTKIDA